LVDGTAIRTQKRHTPQRVVLFGGCCAWGIMRVLVAASQGPVPDEGASQERPSRADRSVPPSR
jgi:hypothetical protein